MNQSTVALLPLPATVWETTDTITTRTQRTRQDCVGVELNQEYKVLIEERIQKGIEIHEKHG